MKINVHVGAHKTATTYLQSILKTNLRRLNANGIGYVPLNESRQFLTGKLLKHEPALFNIESLVDGFFPHARSSEVHGLIVSDENLLGTCGEFADSGVLYPNVFARLRHLRELLAAHDLHLFFSIRSYDTFFAAAYCESLRNRRGYTPFGDFWARVKLDQCRWPGVVSQITEALQPDETSLWRYEDFRENSATIIRQLAFDWTGPLEADERAVERASFSVQALDVLQVLSKNFPRDVVTRLVEPIGNSLPKRDGFAAFYPFEPAEAEKLRLAYDEDCSQLSQTLMNFSPEKPREKSGAAHGHAA